MNQIVHLNTVNRIVRAWTITSNKYRYLSGFLKPGYGKKIIKDNTVRSILSFHKTFINLQKILQSDTYCPLKDSLLIFIKSSCFISLSSIFWKFESGIIRVDPYCPFRKIWPTFIKNTFGSLLYFFDISSKFWPRSDTVWPILAFQGYYICYFKDLIQILKRLNVQTFIKKLFLGQYSLTHIFLPKIL